MMCAAAAAAAAAAGGGAAAPSMGFGVRVLSSGGGVVGAADDFFSTHSTLGSAVLCSSCPAAGGEADGWCRGRYPLLLSGRALAERYRSIYTTAISDKEQGLHPGRGKKALSKKKLKRRQKNESLDGTLCIPDIKLHSNPSAFNVYCNVRHCVLEWQQRQASLALASRGSVQSGDSDSEEEEYREPPVKLPK
ncbi:hypothetical protein CRUP_026030, partial [Coryphaenoides rupestris]